MSRFIEITVKYSESEPVPDRTYQDAANMALSLVTEDIKTKVKSVTLDSEWAFTAVLELKP